MAKKAKMVKSKPGPPTQSYLDIAEIRDDMVLLKDGTVRAVLLVSSLNFALKSQDEQQAIIQAYMQFLNSLEYPLQIVVQSRKMNIDAYLQAMRDQLKTQQNELLKTQIRDYVAFVGQLVDLGSIMTKRFYVVVPYDPITDKKKNFFTRLGEVLSPARILRLKRSAFEARKKSLDERTGLLMGNLNSMNLQSVRLDTQGLIELYYSVYNPDVAEVQKLSDVNKIRVEDAGTITA